MGPLCSKVSRPVEGVGWTPLFDGLFAIEEDEVDAVTDGRMGAEVLAEGDEEGGGAGSVVGTYEVDVFEWIVGLVVGAEDDDAVFPGGAGGREFDDDVA